MAGKGIEVVGNLVGSEGLAQTGSNIVAQQEKDIAAGGYTASPTLAHWLTPTRMAASVQLGLDRREDSRERSIRRCRYRWHWPQLHSQLRFPPLLHSSSAAEH